MQAQQPSAVKTRLENIAEVLEALSQRESEFAEMRANTRKQLRVDEKVLHITFRV